MKEFAGKVAGITGAANGIGEAFALEAARRGMNLALIDIEGDRLQEVKKECEALGAPKVVTITVDVSEYEQVRMSVERIMAEFERIDVFYSNAGVAGAGTLGNIPAQDWDWITSVNFLGMAYYVTEVLPIMKKQGTDAYFLFTVSIGGLQPGMRIQSAYTASKHAAMSLAESVKDYAVNYAPYIGVTAFCPEYVNTTIWDSEKRRPEKFQKPYDPFYATSDYQDYKANFEGRIKNQGYNPRFVGPRLFRAMEDEQLYVHPHVHTHQMLRDRFARIEPTCARTKSSTPSSRRSRATTTEQSRIRIKNRSTSRPGGALFCIPAEENGRGRGKTAAPASSESFVCRFFGQRREIGIAVFQKRVDVKGILQLEQQRRVRKIHGE